MGDSQGRELPLKMLDAQTEMSRLFHGKLDDPPPSGLDPFELEVTCDSDANEVLARTQSVLAAVLAQSPERWPTLPEWLGILPNWFVQASRVDRADADGKASLEGHEQQEPVDEDTIPWSVEEFVLWFEPAAREWCWWGAEIRDGDHFIVSIAVEEALASHDALEWLLRAAGAKK